MTGVADCPDEAELSRFVTRMLPATAAATVENHVADCDSCRNLLFALATPSDTDAAAIPQEAKVGRFELSDVVGRGAMGVVYRARDPELDRIVALKMHHRQSRLDSDQQDRLRREAQALARIADMNVVGVFETGVHDGKPFVVMEYVAGETLESWLTTRRPVREIVDVLIHAGRGLAAAHAGGLVHRDFKPSNVLVSSRGSVKVGDFGLVRHQGAPESAPALGADDDTVALTLTGTLLGTPAYMAPEQLAGHVATAASDQFSFCVVLYEALYGKRPFRGGTLGELRASIANPVTFPTSPRIPGRLRAVLTRGLAYDAASRFPSMHALLAALAPARRRAWPYAAGFATIVAAGTTAFVLFTRPADDPCANANESLSGVWDPAIKEKVRTKLSASSLPYARDAWLGVERILDAYTTTWTQARRSACQATRVHREQNEQELTLRNHCLDARVHELRSLTSALLEADDAMVGRSVQAASRLSAIAPCADVRTLSEQASAISPQTMARADQLRNEITRGTGLANLGKLREGAAIVEQAAAVAKREQLTSVEAQALLELGRLRFQLDGDAAQAEKTVTAALLAADRSRDDYLRVRALTVLSHLVGVVQNRFDDADRLFEQGDAVVQRLVGAETFQAQLLGNRGDMVALRGQPEEGERLLRQSADLLERASGPFDPELAAVYSTLSVVKLDLGAHEDALRLAERAYEIDKHNHGDSHPETAKSLHGVARVLTAMGKHEEALARNQRVIATLEAALGKDHVDLATSYEQRGIINRRLLRFADSETAHRRALDLREKGLGPDHMGTAIALDNLGLVIGLQGRLAEALPLHRRALAITEKVLGLDNIETAASHGYLANIYWQTDKLPEALAAFRRAREVSEAALGPDSFELTFYLSGEGHVLLDMKRPREAVVVLERAMKLRDTTNADPVGDAEVQFALARALWDSGGDKQRARELATAARPAVAERDRPTVEKWLVAHR